MRIYIIIIISNNSLLLVLQFIYMVEPAVSIKNKFSGCKCGVIKIIYIEKHYDDGNTIGTGENL